MLKLLHTKKIFSPLLLGRGFAKKIFVLPDLGEKIKDGEIKKLYVKEGSMVSEYDPIAEVATDKATAEITSPFNGKILKIFHKENEMCNVGDPVFEIELADEAKISDSSKQPHPPTASLDSAKDKPQAKEDTSHHAKPSSDSDDDDNQRASDGQVKGMDIRTSGTKSSVRSTPAVRAFAKQNNVDITKIKPSGENNRVLKEDIVDYLEHFQKVSYQLGLLKPAEKTSGEAEKTEIEKPVAIKMNSFERGMVKSMTYAATVPHFNLNEEYVIEELAQMREKLKTRGVNISLFALVAKAFSLALHDSPKMNSTYTPEKDQFAYYLNESHNISIAIDSQFGLVAPNIKNVETLSAEDIDREVKKLRDLANSQKLTNEHLTGGTIGLSNVGTIAGHYATPLNVPGQTCIVALGKVQFKPWYDETSGSFVPKRILPVSFGCDHRILDGATVAKFSVQWKNYIENPYLILAKLK